MTYVRSVPLNRWLTARSAVIGVLAEAHAHIGDVAGPGRPRDVSKPLAHAYVIGALGQFQGFCRDLHDLAVERLVSASGATPSFVSPLTEAMTKGRGLDRGNATVGTIGSDFQRLGMKVDISVHNSRWKGNDSKRVESLFQLRNALAHGNERELEEIRSSGTQDTISWARSQMPVLNRIARSLDHLVWDHLKKTTGANPWR